MKQHNLKILPEYFRSVMNGEKMFELRRNDRDYSVGDILNLQEYDGKEYTGQECVVKITYIFAGGKLGLSPDYCILGIELLRQKDKIEEVYCNHCEHWKEYALAGMDFGMAYADDCELRLKNKNFDCPKYKYKPDLLDKIWDKIKKWWNNGK